MNSWCWCKCCPTFLPSWQKQRCKGLARSRCEKRIVLCWLASAFYREPQSSGPIFPRVCAWARQNSLEVSREIWWCCVGWLLTFTGGHSKAVQFFLEPALRKDKIGWNYRERFDGGFCCVEAKPLFFFFFREILGDVINRVKVGPS